MHLVYRRTCRVCGCQKLTPVLDLGPQHLQGSFVKEGKELPPMRKVPLKLVRCDVTLEERACGLLQLSHSTPTEILYSAYWYRSGTNQTMRNHLAGIATRAGELIGKDGARALDIGCNDGTLLDAYPRSWRKFGVDPSDVASTVAGDITVVRDLFPSARVSQLAEEAPFDVITSIAMFYDLEDPVAFVREVKRCLAPEGLWVFKMSYMPTMLEMNSYDTICHEHLEYYSLAVLENIVERAGMKIFDAELNSINGGSIRCYATHVDNFAFKRHEPSPRLAALRTREFELELDTDRPYRDFQSHIEAHRDELRDLLRRLRQEGKTIHVYGASTKGNTILQFCGIDNATIVCAADRNPEKHGARTLGTDIPIVSEEQSRAMRPDYYLVLPWHFKEEFVERERATLERGTAMIFPLPTIEIIPAMTSVVLGGNGQDGSYLVASLLRRGRQVVSVGAQPAPRWPGPFRYCSLDLRQPAALVALLAEVAPDEVYHFAAVHKSSAGAPYEGRFGDMLAVNVASVQLALEQLRKKPGRLLYASSIKAFGEPPPALIDEHTPRVSGCLYALTKNAARDVIDYYRRSHGVQGGVLYLGNHESPRRPAEFFIPKLARALAGEATTFHTLDFHCDWGSAEEYADIAVDALERAPGEDLLLASGRCLHARTLADELFAARGRERAVYAREVGAATARPAPYRVALDKLEQRVGRRPGRSIESVIEEIAAEAATPGRE